ncbi:ATP-binding cassette domain-containing protein [Nocardioides sp. LMS-CY]|uniref:NitT/TauT family transport system ATP-binding protein n=1 Tax=Nocardioides soli TaxID=1036020 RepID=A0A7W4Z2S1_9ACTN|nr:ABC transporter ATP-binding protein [Nocardioides sp. LMS-CY]MBB3044764.1 NitT/TauT family transport system ATP-binding protein [Nocardioides soli]QWF19981.1 ATP-binding cassette domain-containing protein [Nocardioides sp. LMS-CY]
MSGAIDRAAVSVRAVSKAYGGVPAVDGISFELAPGSFVALVGPSGCGKSSLLEIMAGIRGADRGEVVVGGRRVDRPIRSVGVMFQEDTTLPWRTVYRNVAFPLEASRRDRHEIAAKVEAALRMVDLWEHRTMHPAALSGGMRQRVSLARVLATDPSVLLLDEPFGALDEQLRLRLGLEVQRICREQGRTAVLITHSIQEAVLLADRVLVLSGRPATVVQDLEVPLPDHRSADQLGDPRVAQVVAKVWASLAY